MFDAIVIGAGVVGVSTARALVTHNSNWKVLVLEKETAVARHASGRNSGVVHAGFNQKPGTLKAKLCVEGNRRLKEFAQQTGVPWLPLGTVVVAQNSAEEETLKELLRRGTENGVPGLKIISREELKDIEPNAVASAALVAPSGAIVESQTLVEKLAQDAKERGAQFSFVREVLGIERRNGHYQAKVRQGADLEDLEARLIVNCAGLYSDKVAHSIGVGLKYTIVPFRGEYYKMRPEKSDIIRSMVYPAPDLRYPFLGVHWTKKVDGSVAVGPNAVLAFGRESYELLDIHWKEVFSMLTQASFRKMASQKEFFRLAKDQIALSFSKEAFLEAASRLVRGARVSDLKPGTAGNRPQLVNDQGEMVDDIVVEREGRTLHVLNAVSPGFTSSLAFAEYLTEELLKLS